MRWRKELNTSIRFPTKGLKILFYVICTPEKRIGETLYRSLASSNIPTLFTRLTSSTTSWTFFSVDHLSSAANMDPNVSTAASSTDPTSSHPSSPVNKYVYQFHLPFHRKYLVNYESIIYSIDGSSSAIARPPATPHQAIQLLDSVLRNTDLNRGNQYRSVIEKPFVYQRHYAKECQCFHFLNFISLFPTPIFSVVVFYERTCIMILFYSVKKQRFRRKILFYRGPSLFIFIPREQSVLPSLNLQWCSTEWTSWSKYINSWNHLSSTVSYVWCHQRINVSAFNFKISTEFYGSL